MRGVLKVDYHYGRLKRIDYRYRLNRRTSEVLAAIENNYTWPVERILDLGAADGLMLSKIKDNYPKAECIGIEYLKELIATNKDKRIKIIRGDVQEIPFADNRFDIVIAAAIIEHLKKPQQLIVEAYRVLRVGGILIITTPNPFFEKIASLAGLLSGDEHQRTFNLKVLKEYLIQEKFEVISLKRFMISPVGLPFDLYIEKFLNKIKLNSLFLNQIAIGKK